MKFVRGIAYFMLVIIILVGIYFGSGFYRTYDLKKQGEEIVNKVEAYRKEYGYLPINMTSFGMEEGDGVNNPYYVKKDELHYIVAFGVGFDESIIYFSDSHQWENKYRLMK